MSRFGPRFDWFNDLSVFFGFVLNSDHGISSKFFRLALAA